MRKATVRIRVLCRCLCMPVIVGAALGAIAAGQSATDIVAKTRVAYGALDSYSDTGVVLAEYGGKDQHHFSTYFSRSPRRFLFDFRKQGGDRFVIWGDPEAFHTWWKATGVASDFPNPNNLPATNQSGYVTSNSITKIPALLYKTDRLQGIFTNFVNGVVDASEEIGGHKCYLITGRTSDIYGNGNEVNVRKLIVWIDAESYLVRKTQEEWTPLGGTINRTTTTFEPQANPKVDPRQFEFVAPGSK